MTPFIVFCVSPRQELAIHFDCAPQFRFAFFDYSGTGHRPDCSASPTHAWSVKTHGKGELLRVCAGLIPEDADYIGVLDDDVHLRVSDINRLLFLGRLHRLDIFQPSLSHESDTNFPHLKNRPGTMIASTTFVEVMAPFFSRQAFEECRDLFSTNVSGWGVDIVWSHRVLQRQGRLGIVHAVTASHLRPTQSQDWVMPNGEKPLDEMRKTMRENGLESYHVQ